MSRHQVDSHVGEILIYFPRPGMCPDPVESHKFTRNKEIYKNISFINAKCKDLLLAFQLIVITKFSTASQMFIYTAKMSIKYDSIYKYNYVK